MNETDPFKLILKRAAEYEPFGEPGEFGFETRLRAALQDSGFSTADWIALFSFRFSAALLPVLLAVAAVIAFQNYGTLPEGVGGFVAHWLTFLPTSA